MEIIVRKCKDCQFMYCNRDDDMYCHHPRYYHKGSPMNVWPGDKIPEWCPIIDNPVTIKVVQDGKETN